MNCIEYKLCKCRHFKRKLKYENIENNLIPK